MKFFEHVDVIVGTRDRVLCGPQRPMTEAEVVTFENEVYKKELDDFERTVLAGICQLTQYALAHQEAGIDAIENSTGYTSVNWLLDYVNDRHERILGTHPSMSRE